MQKLANLVVAGRIRRKISFVLKKEESLCKVCKLDQPTPLNSTKIVLKNENSKVTNNKNQCFNVISYMT